MVTRALDRSLLVVDDDRDALEILSLTLEAHGYDVTRALGGAAAIRAGSADSFVLAIVDVTMPSIDGLSTAISLRQMQPNLRIAFHTALAEAIVRERFPYRYDLFLPKTLDPDALLQRIAGLIQASLPN